MHEAELWKFDVIQRLQSLRLLDDERLAEALPERLRQNPDSARAIRNLVMLPAIKDGNMDRAWAVNTALTESAQDEVLFWNDRLRIAASRMDHAGIRSAAAGFDRLGVRNAELARQLLHLHLKARDLEAAQHVAIQNRALWGSDRVLDHLAALALFRAGNFGQVLELGRVVTETNEPVLEFAKVVADSAIREGQASEAVAFLQRANVGKSDDPQAWYLLARASQLSGADSETVLVAARRAAELAPNDPRIADILAQCHLDRGDPDLALRALEDVPPVERSLLNKIALVPLLEKTGRVTEAIELAHHLSSEQINNHALIRRLTGLLVRNGEIAEAGEYYERNVARRRNALPSDFATGVQAIRAGDLSRAGKLPQGRLDWLFSQLEARNCAPDDRREWENSVYEGLAIDRLTLDWLEACPQRIAEIADGIGMPLNGEAAIRSHITEGRGVFFVGAHLGLLFGGLAALVGAGIRASVVASIPNFGTTLHARHLISTSTLGHSRVARAVATRVRDGEAIVIAIDGASSMQGGAPAEIFDREITISQFAPKLAWRLGTPTVFICLCATRTGSELTLNELPRPVSFPDEASYIAAWSSAYAAQVTGLLQDRPAAARASGGFWESIY